MQQAKRLYHWVCGRHTDTETRQEMLVAAFRAAAHRELPIILPGGASVDTKIQRTTTTWYSQLFGAAEAINRNPNWWVHWFKSIMVYPADYKKWRDAYSVAASRTTERDGKTRVARVAMQILEGDEILCNQQTGPRLVDKLQEHPETKDYKRSSLETWTHRVVRDWKNKICPPDAKKQKHRMKPAR